MPGGAPEGNRNSANGKRFHKAVERILARKYGDVDKGYEALAKIYVETAESGNEKVLLDVIDRADGKSTQVVAGPGDEGEHRHKIEVSIIDVKPD